MTYNSIFTEYVTNAYARKWAEAQKTQSIAALNRLRNEAGRSPVNSRHADKIIHAKDELSRHENKIAELNLVKQQIVDRLQHYWDDALNGFAIYHEQQVVEGDPHLNGSKDKEFLFEIILLANGTRKIRVSNNLTKEDIG